MKRLYTRVDTAAVAGGHQVRLDGRPLKTPRQRPLVAPTAALAERVAGE